MNSFVFALNIVSVFALLTATEGNSCLELFKCVTAEYRNALKDQTNIKEVCRVVQKTVACMDDKLENCDNDNMASRGIRQRDRMVAIIEDKCGGQATEVPQPLGIESDDCTGTMTRCSKLTTNGNTEDSQICKMNKDAKSCIEQLSDCSNKAATTPIIEALKSMTENCSDEGCAMADQMNCLDSMSPGKVVNETCEDIPNIETCMDKLGDKCKTGISLKYYTNYKEKVAEVKKECKEMGYDYSNSAICFERIKTSHLIILAVTVILTICFPY